MVLQVQALAELVYAVTSINPMRTAGTGGQAFTMSQPYLDTMRCLGKFGVRDALLAHLRSIDLTSVSTNDAKVISKACSAPLSMLKFYIVAKHPVLARGRKEQAQTFTCLAYHDQSIASFVELRFSQGTGTYLLA